MRRASLSAKRREDPPPDAGLPDAHLTERTLGSEDVFHGKLLHVRRDLVRLPDGAEATREYIVHPGAVMVIARLA